MDSPLLLCSYMRRMRRPVIGIMARPRVEKGIFKGKQGPVLLKYLQTAAACQAFACVFDPADVDFIRQRLIGYVLDSAIYRNASVIQKVDLPLPAVIYDQILSRRYEKSAPVTATRAFLKESSFVFNDGYFDKWQVYEWLATDPNLRRHLPHTALLTTAHVLRKFTQSYSSLFVKPIHGSLGLGIVKLTRSGATWHAMLRTKDGNAEEQTYNAPADIFTAYRKRWLGAPHVVQEGLSLVEQNERPIDIRVIVQKAHDAAWHTTKTYVRMAGLGEFISNLTTGGEAFPLSFLQQIDKKWNMPQIKKEIRKLAQNIPLVMEQQSNLLLGELGIDLGLDTAGRMYIIEVNSKPWKTPATVNGSAELVELSFERPIRFALQLASSLDARRERQS